MAALGVMLVVGCAGKSIPPEPDAGPIDAGAPGPVAPAGLTYGSNPAAYTVNQPISANNPSSTGGPVNFYLVSPDLPPGLTLNPSTGVLSGTPTAEIPATSYTVAAVNSVGSTFTVLTLEVDGRLREGVIAAGGSHTCAVIDGGVQCWGSDFYGELGDNRTKFDSSVPVHVVGLSTGVQTVAAGADHSCALVNEGIQCWGRNQRGQLGNNSTIDSSVPVPVPGLSAGVQAIDASDDSTCAVVDGGVLCWGAITSGLPGYLDGGNSFVPVSMPGLSGVQAVSGSYALVNGGLKNLFDHGAIAFGLDSGVQAISSGALDTCVLFNGGVQCQGDNTYGQLGVSTPGYTFRMVPSGPTSAVRGLAVGVRHACALVHRGVQCWGDNSYSQLGNGADGGNSFTPVQVVGLSTGVQAISSQFFHSCALVNGGFQCWGSNFSGELGDGSYIDRHVPVPVVGLTSGL